MPIFGVLVHFEIFENNLQKTITKNYHVYKVIVVLHYYNKSFGFK